MTEIVKGTRVRVTYEGVVKDAYDDGTFTFRVNGRITRSLYLDEVGIAEVEVLAPPEREFEEGAYYLDPNMAVYRYKKKADQFHSYGYTDISRPYCSTEWLSRLIKLIPET